MYDLSATPTHTPVVWTPDPSGHEEGSGEKPCSEVSCCNAIVFKFVRMFNVLGQVLFLSLAPRLFPPPVLVTCSMQRWREKAWQIESCVWRQVDVRVDMGGREGVVSNHCNSQSLHWSALSLPNNKLYCEWKAPSYGWAWQTYLPSSLDFDAVFWWMLQSQVLGQDLEILRQALPPSRLPWKQG